MNPVKPREAIKAYKIHNVKNFAIDNLSEYKKKILEETNYANDLNIHLRLKNFIQIISY